ncbi:MAG: hypothetical protein Hyperionvirus6_21 [Hyperionvirus sp.]|uniref:Uncharacterized protein n=1 Tax=Hyperionvirus sp. TaxID=2487770 RepID=A0A3G5A7T6_9VIRU|nr:MAG: hypothetical protein Hyperionvirus6_21 [Hyperionvirus sp.]
MNSEDGNACAFFARYYDPRDLPDLKSTVIPEITNRLGYFARAYVKGERFYSPFIIAESMKEYQFMIDHSANDSKTDHDFTAMEKLLKESCIGGHPEAHMAAIYFLCNFGKEHDIATALFSKGCLLGQDFIGINYSHYFDYDDVSEILIEKMKTLEDARKVLECAANVYIGIEERIESKQMDRFYYEPEADYSWGENVSCWEKKELAVHTTFLKNILKSIIEEFGVTGLKIINDYCFALKNKLLIGWVRSFLDTSELRIKKSI